MPTTDPGELPRLLGLLEFREADAVAFVAGLDRLTDADLDQISVDEARLRANVGRVEDRSNPVAGWEVAHQVGIDFPLLVALVRVAPLVQRELVRRGVDEAVAWHSVADLGQQVHVHRLVHGAFGFGARDWVPVNYSGSLLWLGRLQFTLEPDPWSLGVHIPETGPLTPEAVDEALGLARTVAVAAYGEVAVERFTCDSWLLDPNLVARLDPASNVAAFASRFAPLGDPTRDDRAAIYFGFHKETKDGQELCLDALPQSTSLQRAIVALLRADGASVQKGWFPLRG